MGLSRFPPWKPLWGGNTTHPSPINISLRSEGPRTFQGKVNSTCAVWSDNLQLRSATSLASQGIQRKRESSAKGRHCYSDWVTFWMTLVSDSSLSEPGNSHAHPPKKWGRWDTFATAQSGREEDRAEAPTWWRVGHQKIVFQRHIHKLKPSFKWMDQQSADDGEVLFTLCPPIHVLIQQKLTCHLLGTWHCAWTMNKAEIMPPLWLTQL